MNQVLAHRMTPTHVPPGVTEWVVLIKKMIFVLEFDQTVGIVHPILGRAEVVLGTIRFPVRRRLGEK